MKALDVISRVAMPQQIAETARPIALRHHVNELYLFGSMARGEGHADSDIDFIYQFDDTANPMIDEWALRDDLASTFGREIDLVKKRAKIEELTGEELVDEDYDSAVDGVIIWWRDGDDEDELADTIVDAYAVLGDDGPLWVLTPKPGRPGAASSSTVQSAAKTAGMNAATPLTVSSDWNGIHLRAFGKGK